MNLPDSAVSVGRRSGFIPKDGSIVTLVKRLPMAFVMIAGPQILSAIFLATSENWRRNSAAYLAGCGPVDHADRHDRVRRGPGRLRRRGV